MAFLSGKHMALSGQNFGACGFRGAWLSLLMCLLLGSSPRTSAQELAREYELKAAFLYNFLLFVEWPAGSLPAAGQPLLIGVLGSDPFGASLDQVTKGRTVNGHPLLIVRMKDLRSWAPCHLLFVCQSEKKSVAQILRMLGSQNILTVGDHERFCEQGGMLNFYLDGAKVRFEVNRVATERAGLKLDPKLLKLARIVEAPAPEP